MKRHGDGTEAFRRIAVERIDLAPGLSISRVLTGLWQIADMERDGRTVDPDRAAAAMAPYVAAGLTTFDMADHYGSAELIAGTFRARHGAAAQLLTKWVPKPGRVTKADVRAAVDRARTRLRRRVDRPAAVSRLELRRPELARDAVPPAGAEARGPDPPARTDQRRHRASANGRCQRHRGGVEPGVVLAASISARPRGWRRTARRTACSSSPTAPSPAGG